MAFGNREILPLGDAAVFMRRLVGGRIFGGVRDLADSIAIRMNYPPFVVRDSGITVSGFLRHRSFLQGIASGRYEIITRKIICALVPEASVFIDAGAHIGYFSLLVCSQLRPAAIAYAIEPDPYNVRALRINLNRNGCQNIRIIQKAVSGECGSSVMLFSDASIGNSLILGRSDIGRAHRQSVDTLTIESLLEGVPLDTVLVKMDLEGAELLALPGMRSAVERSRRFGLICENNPSALEAGGRTPADLIHGLRDLGFEIYYASDEYGGLLGITPDYPYKGNLFCVRNWDFPKEWILP